MIIRGPLDVAARRELVDRNVVDSAQLRLPRASRTTARAWTAPRAGHLPRRRTTAAARPHRLPTLLATSPPTSA
jgi:hypothetical protein